MAGEYDINLSNGSVLSTLYPLETNGPDNRSTPRQIHQALPEFPVHQITVLNVVKVKGDKTGYFPVGAEIKIVGSTTNNGTYTVHNVVVPGTSTPGSYYDSGQDETSIILATPMSTATSDGKIVINSFVIEGDMTARFVAGFEFDVQLSGSNDASYNVANITTTDKNNITRTGSYFTGVKTVIPVTTGINSNGLPLGQIQYTTLDAHTSLKLPGKGSLHYGEMLVENMVRMVENFAADQPPELNTSIGTNPAAQPLEGQLWFNTTATEQGMFTYRNDAEYPGGEWTRDFDIGTGELKFTDPQHPTATAPNNDFILSGDDALFPDVGVALRVVTNPNSGDSLFRVLSGGGGERLRVEHDGSVLLNNNLEVLSNTTSSNASFIDGTLSIGGRVDGNIARATPTQTLTVQGNGIAVNSDAGNNANLTLNSYASRVSNITFSSQGTVYGEIRVDSSLPTTPLQINAITARDVLMVQGGGYVGINVSSPTHRLTVDGDAWFSENITMDTADIIFDAGYGIETPSGSFIKTTTGVNNPWVIKPNNDVAGSLYVQRADGQNILVVDTTTAGVHVNTYNFTVDNGTLRVLSDNNFVGINIMTPMYPLHVVGDTYIDGNFEVNGYLSSIGSWRNPEVLPDNLNWNTIEEGGIYVLSSTNATNSPSDGANYGYILEVHEYAGGLSYGTQTAKKLESGKVREFKRFQVANVWSSWGEVIHSLGDQYVQNNINVISGTTYHQMSQGSHDFVFTANAGQDNVSPNTIWRSSNTGGAIVERMRLDTDGTLVMAAANYDTLVTSDNDVPNKKYVDSLVGAVSWREPVEVLDDTLYSSQVSFPTGLGTIIDGEVIFEGMRVLFSNVTTTADKDIWIYNHPGWVRDLDNPRTIGDAVYVKFGTEAGKAFAYDKDDNWELITGSGGGGASFIREEYVATPGQTIFTLTNSYKLTPTGSRLMVYVNGVKYIHSDGYDETGPKTVTINPAAVGGEIVEFYILEEVTSNVAVKREYRTGLTGTPTINFTSITYPVDDDSLMVYLNGQKMISGIDYTEVTSTSINWTGVSLIAADSLEFYSAIPLTAGTKLEDVDNVSNAAPTDGDVLIYNSSLGVWEHVDSSTLGSATTPGTDIIEETGNGVVTDFSVPFAQATIGGFAFQQVFMNGILQKENASYTVPAPGTISFLTAPPLNADILVYKL